MQCLANPAKRLKALYAREPMPFAPATVDEAREAVIVAYIASWQHAGVREARETMRAACSGRVY